MFKKPKRNFRGKQPTEGELIGGEISKENLSETEEEAEGLGPVIVKPSKAKKSLVKAPTAAGNKSSKKEPVFIRSFGDEEDEGEVFKIKKSSHSRKVAKQLKRERKKEQEGKTVHHKPVKQEAEKTNENPVSDGQNGGADMELDSDTEEITGEEQEKDKEESHAFRTFLERGEIPDAHMIHAARKKRQHAREVGDFIPLESTDSPSGGPTKYEKVAAKSRLIRDDDLDASGDEERMEFAVNMAAKERQQMRDNFLSAEHGSDVEGDEEKRQRLVGEASDRENENDWEEQQIRKAVGVSAHQTDDRVKESKASSLQCPECPMTYTSMHWYNKHIQDKHGEQRQEEAPVSYSDDDIRVIQREAVERVKKNPLMRKKGVETLAELEAWTKEKIEAPRSLIEDITKLIPKSKHNTQSLTQKAEGLWKMRRASGNISARSQLNIVDAVYATLGERQLIQKRPTSQKNCTKTPHITEDTKQSLYYVGGYFIKSMLKTKNPDLQDFLQRWVIDEENANKNSEWTTMQNRGGLKFIANEFYDMLLVMETLSTTILKKGLKARKIADLVSSTIMGDSDVQSQWEHATSRLSPAHATSLLETLVRKFSSLRCTAFAAKLDQQYCATKRSIGWKRSAGLRAALHRYSEKDTHEAT